MKKVIAIIIAVGILTTAMFAYQVMAAGGKVRGEKGQGGVYQWCNSVFGDCPFFVD